MAALHQALGQVKLPHKTVKCLVAARPPFVNSLLRWRRASPGGVRSPLATSVAMVEREQLSTLGISTFSSIMDDEDEFEESERIEVDAEQEVDETLQVANLGLSPITMEALAARNIFTLFPIQKVVLQPIMEGRDLIGRAKTGSGKTLAFALPVVENFLEEDATNKPKRGRAPRCIVLTPTRELANQVAREFQTLCPSLKVDSFYGGAAIGNQMRALTSGIDVAVGTPGRVIDLIDRGALRLDAVRFAILDEADQMLDMGFEEDMERILSQAPAERQTLLFSATMPKWINKVARRFQKNPLTVDLVGEENTGKLADTIKLLVMQVEGPQKVSALGDLLSVYASGGKAIVFVNTKARADEIAQAVGEFTPCEQLHGDISQGQREKALQQFRDGRFSVLVATDVAARGLDIPNVDLVVHFDVPQDDEAFLHRSGRTGRAGNTGTAVVMFTERDARTVGLILKATKTDNAELIGAPDPADVMMNASKSVLTKLDKVDSSMIEFFVPAAERLLASDQPVRILAAALASMSGFRGKPQARSLLTYEQGFITLRLLGKPGAVDSWIQLCKVLGQLVAQAKLPFKVETMVGKMKVLDKLADGRTGAAFDLPAGVSEQILASCVEHAEQLGYTLDRPKTIALDVNEMMVGGGRRGPSRDGGRGSWGNGGSRSGGSSYGRGSSSGYGRSGSDRGASSGYGRGADRGGGGGGGGGRSASSSSGGYGASTSGGAGYGRSSGSYGSDRAALPRTGGYTSGGGGGGYASSNRGVSSNGTGASSSAAGKGAWSDFDYSESYFDGGAASSSSKGAQRAAAAGGADVFDNPLKKLAPRGAGGSSRLAGAKNGKWQDAPATDDGWAKW